MERKHPLTFNEYRHKLRKRTDIKPFSISINNFIDTRQLIDSYVLTSIYLHMSFFNRVVALILMGLNLRYRFDKSCLIGPKFDAPLSFLKKYEKWRWYNRKKYSKREQGFVYDKQIPCLKKNIYYGDYEFIIIPMIQEIMMNVYFPPNIHPPKKKYPNMFNKLDKLLVSSKNLYDYIKQNRDLLTVLCLTSNFRIKSYNVPLF